jgi:Protein of unknown function (DUF1524)/Excalibur calcium-binding domain
VPRRIPTFVVTLLVVLGGLVAVTPAEAASTAAVHVRLRTAIARLPVAPERSTGYARTKFNLWVDADGDCHDTRDEVLAAETRARVNPGCDVTTGRWFSYYDRATWTKASDVDIDHLVPLKEAWDSGARGWDARTRQRYANDLGDPRTLVAVTDNVNQSKSDRDPAEWLPTYGKCTYLRQWTAVKIRWSLKVDPAEKAALTRLGKRCSNTWVTVSRAAVAKGSSTPTNSSTDGTAQGGGLDPRFATCTAAIAAGYGPYYRGRDPEYAWYTDRDRDGAVCE